MNVSRSRSLSRSRKLLYTAACLLVTLLMVEGALRLRAWVRYGSTTSKGLVSLFEYDPQRQMVVPRAGAEMQGSVVRIKVNSLGFRGEEFPVSKPAGTIRIACLGASTTFCMEATSNETTWPHQLQRLLQAKHPEVQIQVINSGITGTAIENTIKDLKHRVLPLDPDLVILYHANNDIVQDVRQLAMQQGLVDSSAAAQRTDLLAWSAQYSLLAHLIRTNVDLMRGTAAGQKQDGAGKLTQLPPDLHAGFMNRVSELHGLLEERSIPLIISTFPVKFRPEQPRSVQMDHAKLAFFHMPWLTMDQLDSVFDQYNSALVSFAHNRRVAVLTDDDSIPGDDVHFADYMHLTDAGCAKMAERFAGLIEHERILEPMLQPFRKQ